MLILLISYLCGRKEGALRVQVRLVRKGRWEPDCPGYKEAWVQAS